MSSRRFLWGVACLIAVVSVARSAMIWVEGERPQRDTMHRHPWWYDKVKRSELSGGDRISNFAKGKEGTAEYRFGDAFELADESSRRVDRLGRTACCQTPR